MANRTDKEAYAIHGTNPQNLVEYIIRQKIYQTTYWKESCFALTAETLIERAVELKAAGGTYGGARKPTNFMCLLLKMLQIQPAKEIIIEYIKNEDFKYVRLLGAFYMRLVGRPLEVYQYLEPLYNDYRKVRIMQEAGHYSLGHMDEVIDMMLNKDFLFDIALPRLPARLILEKGGQLDPRISVLDEEFDEQAVQAEADAEAARERQVAQEYAEVADGVGARDRDRDRDRDERDKDRGERDKDRDRDRGREARDVENGHQYDERRRDDSPDRKRGKERWQLTKEERREQAARRRSPSRSRSRERRHRSHSRERQDRDRGRDRTGRPDREGRDRDRSRERERGRDRRRSRSHSRDRRERSRSREHARRHDDRDRRDRDKDRDREEGGSKGKRERDGAGSGKARAGDEDQEIAEANALRASLGLKPLK